MSAVEERTPTDEIEGTAMLPILPLRESVVFPASVTPLAIGQERSIRLVDEAVASDQTSPRAPPRRKPNAPMTFTRSARRRSSTR